MTTSRSHRAAPRREQGLRTIALAMLCVVAMAAAFIVRALHEGERELQHSDAAFNRGRLNESLRAARRAAVWSVPGAPHVEAAYARMRAIALGAETTGKRELARRAWTAIRGAVIETRSPFARHEHRFEEASRNVARLLAAEKQGREHTGVTQKALESKYASAGPLQAWGLVVGGAFVLMLLGSVLAFWGAEHKRRWSVQLMPALLLAGGLCLWVWAAIQS